MELVFYFLNVLTPEILSDSLVPSNVGVGLISTSVSSEMYVIFASILSVAMGIVGYFLKSLVATLNSEIITIRRLETDVAVLEERANAMTEIKEDIKSLFQLVSSIKTNLINKDK
tara:strand:- start:1753 stop:2097 length:345 start_codon:yes stop_codon:yes gene_type:complete